MARIVLILSSSDHWTLADGTRHRTGFWAEELVVPHRTFTARGVDIVVATPGGAPLVVDPASLRPPVVELRTEIKTGRRSRR